mmetsp:Transcript_39064/g.117417  ORF Transcript_39064/g.117417 Transcript_39064/m.117417 type:complete len:210 (-) Transcript_39064:107-736(-)
MQDLPSTYHQYRGRHIPIACCSSKVHPPKLQRHPRSKLFEQTHPILARHIFRSSSASRIHTTAGQVLVRRHIHRSGKYCFRTPDPLSTCRQSSNCRTPIDRCSSRTRPQNRQYRRHNKQEGQAPSALLSRISRSSSVSRIHMAVGQVLARRHIHCSGKYCFRTPDPLSTCRQSSNCRTPIDRCSSRTRPQNRQHRRHNIQERQPHRARS